MREEFLCDSKVWQRESAFSSISRCEAPARMESGTELGANRFSLTNFKFCRNQFVMHGWLFLEDIRGFVVFSLEECHVDMQ